MCIHVENLNYYSAQQIQEVVDHYRFEAGRMLSDFDRQWYTEEADRLNGLLKLKAEEGKMA